MRRAAVGAVVLLAAVISTGAAAEDLKTVEVPDYGYKLKLPEQFTLQGELGQTSTWMYQPGAAGAQPEKKKRRFGIGGGVNLGPVRIGGEAGAGSETVEAGDGDLEPALMVYVNWVHMPNASAETIYNANLQSVRDNINSPNPTYKDIAIFDEDEGYADEGYMFWYKEVDKDDPSEIHRWHIHASGNNSTYTIGLTGTFGQFQEWGAAYEDVIKSFELIPIEE